MKRLCDDHRAELGVEYIGMGDLDRQGACVVCEIGYLRPEVLWFAQQMERKLKENDHKGGWSDCITEWLLKQIDIETREVERAWGDPAAVILECADVANYAMMIADNAARTSEEARDGE